ncbi:MAG: NAD(P)/FAD-dependent oxidoreductase [Solirubrobacterales bacterium]|nr:NAD(P)/FAD-dependent oxidoreductase [Solirubrobacterales bacterium]
MAQSTSKSHRVVIVGAGFGGLFAARALRRARLDVTVVDRTNHHLFQPLLYQVATGLLSPGDIAPPTRDVLRRHQNTRVLLGEVVDVDLRARELQLQTLGQSSAVHYDSLIVAAGARPSYFGHDEFAIDAPGMKTIDDALELRGRIFGAFELAELDPERREVLLTFAIVGAGPTGVELAGHITELARHALKRNFRAFDPARARVVLLDAIDTVLATFPEPLQRRTRRDLERLGVEVRLGTRVTGVDADGLSVENADGSTGRIEAATKIWAAGVRASPLGAILARQSDAAVDRAGRVSVLPDLTLPGHPEVFVVGDLMSLDHLPGVAEVAMQSGHHAARTIVRRVRGDTERRPFRYHDLGTAATIARFRAVVYVGRIRVAGLIGWVVWLVVHLSFLTGFKNRFATIVTWTVAFLGRGRPERTITQQESLALARALQPLPMNEKSAEAPPGASPRAA